jgi:hypothetical protein
LTTEDLHILSGQTELIFSKNEAYVTDLAAAVREHLGQQGARKAERDAT